MKISDEMHTVAGQGEGNHCGMLHPARNVSAYRAGASRAQRGLH